MQARVRLESFAELKDFFSSEKVAALHEGEILRSCVKNVHGTTSFFIETKLC